MLSLKIFIYIGTSIYKQNVLSFSKFFNLTDAHKYSSSKQKRLGKLWEMQGDII